MRTTFIRVTLLSAAIVACHTTSAQVKGTSWLDEAKPASWNTPGRAIPAAPKIQGALDTRCRDASRPPQLDEDRRVRDQGWDLDGAYQGGWDILVLRGTAGYDGMCRPRQYQDFVFVRGEFVGTLSPRPMDSRTDGALQRVFLQSATRLTAEYARYSAKDALCCPSRTTTKVFEVANDGQVLQLAPQTSAPSPSSGLAGTSWQLVKFQGGDDTTLIPDDRAKYTIALAAGGQLTARIDCNRGRGTWKSTGPSQIEFGPLALTRAKCPSGSLHDQIVKQWSYIRTYVIRDGHLFLSLMADGGIYEFEPIPR
jgi:heat shock protein HslJ